MYGVSPSVPMSWIVMMLGWFKAEAERASPWKRERKPGSAANDSGSTLIAISRPSRPSRAFHTWPIPPSPIGERTS